MNGDRDFYHSNPVFDDPELGIQQTFRAMVKALEHPGHLVKIKSRISVPGFLNPASAALFLTLCTDKTTVWADLNWNLSRVDWFHNHYACSIVTKPCMASMALITKPRAMPPLDHFRIGNDEDFDTSATLIVQVSNLSANMARNPVRWIANRMGTRSLTGVPANLWDHWCQQSNPYPMNIDIFLTCDNTLAVMPQIYGN